MIVGLIALYAGVWFLWYAYNQHCLEVAASRFERGKLSPKAWDMELDYRNNLMSFSYAWLVIALVVGFFWVLEKVAK